MAKGEGTTSITYYIGVVNILLAALWGVLFATGTLSTDTNPFSSGAALFYVGTLFILGFGLLFPMIERGWAGRTKINTGLMFSALAVVVYGAYIAAFYQYSRLNFLEKYIHDLLK